MFEKRTFIVVYRQTIILVHLSLSVRFSIRPLIDVLMIRRLLPVSFASLSESVACR